MGVDVPLSVGRGRIPLTASLHSTMAKPATLDVFHGARLVHHLQVALPAGDK
jgi:hypothetical protein